MKQRVISALVIALIFIPIIIVGGLAFNIAFFILTLLGIREFMKARQNEKQIPDFMRFISYLLMTLLYFQNTLSNNLVFSLDYRLISGIFFILLLPVVLYHDDKKYGVVDAFYLLGGVLFLGYSMSLFYMYRSIDLKVIIFLLLITIVTDSYAYFIGRLIGKNKLLEEISPNKTWEGTIGGSLVATFVCTIYYTVVINNASSIIEVGLIVLFLSLVGQFGDLFFSSIKRKFKIKDFSNIMPGHGGVLDRLDSIIFVLLAFTFFIQLI